MSTKDTSNSEFMTVREAAEKHGVTQKTVLRWVKIGYFKGAKQPSGERGKVLIPKSTARGGGKEV